MRQVHYIDCAATILARRQWIHEMELLHQAEADASMTGLMVGVIVLGIVCTGILVVVLM